MKNRGLLTMGWLCMLCSVAVAAEPVSWKGLTDQAFELYKARRYEEAVAITKQALTIAEQTFGADGLPVAESLGNLAALYRLQGKEAEAKPLKDRAVAIRKQHGLDGIPLGLESEAFFDQVARIRSEAAAAYRARDGVAATQTGSDQRMEQISRRYTTSVKEAQRRGLHPVQSGGSIITDQGQGH